VRELTLTDDSFLAGSRPGYEPRTYRRRPAPPSAGIEPLRTVLSSRHLRGLRALAAPDHRLGRAGAEMLAAHPRLGSLEGLDLANNEFGEGDVAVLAGSRYVKALRRLRLGACSAEGYYGYGEEDIGRVGTELAPLAGQLEELDLGSCGVLPGALPLLLSGSRQRPLRVVRLERNPLHREFALGTFGELLASPLLRELRVLDVSSCYVDGPLVQAVTASANLSGLVHLGLRNNPLRTKGVEALASAPRLGRLARLELAGSSGSLAHAGHCFGDKGVKALASGSGLPRLAALDLRRQRLTAKGIGYLAGSRLAEQLTWLDLRGNSLGDTGVKRLLAAKWPALVWLDVRNTDVGPRARAALRKKFGAGVRF
jgi:hypothetical protein